jgi:hypothetical protein
VVKAQIQFVELEIDNLVEFWHDLDNLAPELGCERDADKVIRGLGRGEDILLGEDGVFRRRGCEQVCNSLDVTVLPASESIGCVVVREQTEPRVVHSDMFTKRGRLPWAKVRVVVRGGGGNRQRGSLPASKPAGDEYAQALKERGHGEQEGEHTEQRWGTEGFQDGGLSSLDCVCCAI